MHSKFTQFLVLLLLTACNPEIAMNQEHAAAEADVANGGRGLAKLNPAPRKAYELTLRLKDAPGPFAVVSGVAQYDVVNEEQCGHVEPATGTASRITSQEDVVLHKVSDAEYRGTVYLDLMQDEDYYGRGVCRWEFTGAGAMLKATGAEGETRFLSFIKADEFIKGDVSVRHYLPDDYPSVERLPNYGAAGQEDVSSYLPEFQENLFAVSLSAAKVQQ